MDVVPERPPVRRLLIEIGVAAGCRHDVGSCAGLGTRFDRIVTRIARPRGDTHAGQRHPSELDQGDLAVAISVVVVGRGEDVEAERSLGRVGVVEEQGLAMNPEVDGPRAPARQIGPGKATVRRSNALSVSEVLTKRPGECLGDARLGSSTPRVERDTTPRRPEPLARRRLR